MDRELCPLTKKPFNCQKCKAIKDTEKCPYMIWDEAVDYTLAFLREIVQTEKK